MNIAENGIYLNLGLKKGEAARLLHFSLIPRRWRSEIMTPLCTL